MQKTSFIILALLTFFLFSCQKQTIRGEGTIATRTLGLSGFTKVETYYDIDAVITYGNTPEVKVTGYVNLLDILETVIDNGVLKLKYNSRYNTIRNGNIRFEITIPRLEGAGIYGNCSIDVNNFLAGQQFKGEIYGSGDMTVTNTNYQSAILDIYGSGKIKGEGLQVKNALVNSYGSGHTYISVSERLVTKMYGSGNIYYWGNPAIETSQQGSGRVIKR